MWKQISKMGHIPNPDYHAIIVPCVAWIPQDLVAPFSSPEVPNSKCHAFWSKTVGSLQEETSQMILVYYIS